MKSLFFKSDKDIVSIEITDTSLRIAHIKKRGKRQEIFNIFYKEKEENLEEKIKNFFLKSKIKNPYIILVIPSHLVITKNIEVPSQDPTEIADIMNLQASRHTPYAREEIIIDYTIIGTHRISYTKILLVIVTREVVRRQLEILKKTGIDIDKVCFASEGVSKFLLNLLDLYKYDFPVGFLHIDDIFSYFNIAFRDKVIFVRSIPIGNQHLDSDYSHYAHQFAEEIKKSIEVYKNEDIEVMFQRIILLTDNNHHRELIKFLTQNIEIPTDGISLKEQISLRSDLKNKFSLSYLDVLASAWENETMKIDLMPEEIKLKKAFEEKSRNLIWTGFFSLSIFILIFVFLTTKLTLRRIYLDKLEERSKYIHKEAKEVEEKFKRIQLIKRYLFLRGYPLEILDKIYENIPSTMRLSEIRFDKKNRFLSLKGTADSMTTIYSFVDSLSKEDYFKDVKTKYTTKRKEEDKEVADFELSVILKERFK
jgi:Tfp pilus assembly PilM family ATPase